MTSSIVCGVDGSPGARSALRVAALLSSRLGARLVVAHVVQPPSPSRGFGPTAGGLESTPAESLLSAGNALVGTVLREEQLGPVDRRVVLGYPADSLADIADEEAATLIVVGSRGRGALRSAFLGSVSGDLLGVARCPVVVVPPAASTPSVGHDGKGPLLAGAPDRR